MTCRARAIRKLAEPPVATGRSRLNHRRSRLCLSSGRWRSPTIHSREGNAGDICLGALIGKEATARRRSTVRWRHRIARGGHSRSAALLPILPAPRIRLPPPRGQRRRRRTPESHARTRFRRSRPLLGDLFLRQTTAMGPCFHRLHTASMSNTSGTPVWRQRKGKGLQ